MGLVQLTGPLSDPHQMGRTIIPLSRYIILAREGFLIIQQQCLMRSIHGCLPYARRILQRHAARLHKGKRFPDTVCKMLVFLPQRTAFHEIEIPLMHLVQVCQASFGKSPQ